MTRFPRWISSTASGNDGLIEELHLVDADNVDLAERREELCLQVLGGGDRGCLVCLRAVRGDCRAVVAEVDVGLEAGHALAGDASALEAADQLFGFAGEHRAGNDFETAGCGRGHSLGAFADDLSLS